MLNSRRYKEITRKLALPDKRYLNDIRTTMQEVLELKRDLQSCAGKHQYDGIKVLDIYHSAPLIKKVRDFQSVSAFLHTASASGGSREMPVGTPAAKGNCWRTVDII